jgi:phosphomevalonate kinase
MISTRSPTRLVYFNSRVFSRPSHLGILSRPLAAQADSQTNTTLPPFSPLPNAITKTNKTGLGSSASLVTSLSAALLSHLSVLTLPTPEEADSYHQSQSTVEAPKSLGIIHSVAQYAHCLAQGKVGSGFDISSSVYGTHIYKRFSPSLLEPLLSSNSPPSLVEALDPKKWDQSISPFRLPKGLRLVLADVDAGTNTPSFIRGILKWREEKPEESNEIWGKLFKANTRLVKALEHLRDMEGEEEYSEVLEAAAGLPIEQVSLFPFSRVLACPSSLIRVLPDSSYTMPGQPLSTGLYSPSLLALYDRSVEHVRI